MTMFRTVLISGVFFAIAACDTGPNGFGTAPPGVSQSQYDASVQRQRQAQHDFYRGPRGGGVGLR